jgi:CHAT domain-containing protein
MGGLAKDGELAGLIRLEQDTGRQLAALERTLIALSVAPDDSARRSVVDAQQRYAALRPEHQRLADQLRRRFPDFTALVAPQAASMPTARAVLRDHEAIILIYPAEDATYVWAIPKHGEAAHAVVGIRRDELQDRISRLRLSMDETPLTVGDVRPFDTGVAHSLYADLLAPVASGWAEARSLIFIAGGAVARLPFALLLRAEFELPPDTALLFAGYRKAQWLVRTHSVSTAPSVSSFVGLRTAPRQSPEKAFAGFGDPVFAPEKKADRSVEATDALLASRSAGRTLLRLRAVATPRNLRSAGLADLSSLPDTAGELQAIAGAIGGDARLDVFLKEKATEDAVRTVASNRGVVAFATHGLVAGDLDGLDQPALALTPMDDKANENDGLLTMGEILGMKLNASWVILSACNTAAPDGAGSEAVSGLGQAFFYAGARSLLVSNWSVQTDAASALTTKLFERQAAGYDKAESLRLAMLDLIDNRNQRGHLGEDVYSFAHPLFWAPFMIVGEPSL